MMARKIPSLVDLCVRMAIDNVRYLGDVGETDYHLLDRILCHCTIDQLTHIENSTTDRDLSPVTDKLWKKFYKDSFGEVAFNDVIETLRHKGTRKWNELYQAKLVTLKKYEQDIGRRSKLRYEEEEAKKKARQVKPCSKVPPSSKKRSFWGGANASNIYNTKSSIMKKAKMEFINSREVKNIAAMKTKVVQRTHSIPPKVKPVTTSGFSASSSSSSSNKMIKPPVRRRF